MTLNTVPSAEKIAEVRVNKLAANLIGAVLTVLFCVIGVFLAHLLPHHRPFGGSQAVVLLVCLIILFPVHEMIHAIGLSFFARISWSKIKFGFMWSALTPYCHCTVPIPIEAYRRMGLLPLWVTGAASVIALLIIPSDGLGVFAGVAIGGCVGDVWIVLKLRHFAGDLLVQDSPSDIGCDILSSTAQSTPDPADAIS
jgi:hypothetical protein